MESMVESRKDELLNTVQHKLYDNWTLWAHLPHDTDWSVSSYKKIITLETIEDSLMLFEKFSRSNGKKLYVIFNEKWYSTYLGR